MTAEIAVLNRSAVALAADSAGTIGSGSSSKIYNAFNKIFELSETEPVAIMIYGGLDFMGLPLEILIKEYRRLRRGKTFPSLKGYADDFREFLGKYVGCDSEDHAENVVKVIVGFLRSISHEAKENWLTSSEENGKFLESKMSSILEQTLKDRQKILKNTPWNHDFITKTPDSADRYNDIINTLIDAIFTDINQANRRRLVTLVKTQLMRGELSPQRTGIVVAGFGTDEMCPSLEAIETDGLIYGSLKFKRTESIDIGRRGPHASIVGFAQDDMVGRFINGVDPAYELHALSLIKDVNEEFVSSLEASLLKTSSPDDAATAVAGLRQAFEQMHKKTTEQIYEFRNKQFRKPIIEMIRFMPNQEIATLAASLIDLTSLKRRVSRERETVGGDVDVAVISKSEGFVWIKRKHYFPGDLNPRFFNRMRLVSNIGGS